MIRKNLFKVAIVAMFASSMLFVGCGEDDGGGGDGTFTREDFLGTYPGQHTLLGLLNIPDTIIISPIGAEDSILLFSSALGTAFRGEVTGQDIAFADFSAAYLLLSETNNIYAQDIFATGSAKLQSNKTTLKTFLKVTADVYNLDELPGDFDSIEVFTDVNLNGTFNK